MLTLRVEIFPTDGSFVSTPNRLAGVLPKAESPGPHSWVPQTPAASKVFRS